MTNTKKEIEKNIELILKSNNNKIKILLNNKNSMMKEEYLEDLIRYGYLSGQEAGQKQLLDKFEKMIDECESHSWEGHKCILVEELKQKLKEMGKWK